MLTIEEAKEKTQAVAVPCYGAPEFVGEDEDFIYYKITIPKILLECGGGCGEGCSEGCGTSCEMEEE